MINSKGLNTSAIFGFTNTLLEILSKQKPGLELTFDVPLHLRKGPLKKSKVRMELTENYQ